MRKAAQPYFMRTKILLAVISFIVGYTVPSFAIGEKYFDSWIFTTFEETFKESKDKKKPMMLIIYDEKSKDNSQMDYCLGYYCAAKQTRALISENFIVGILKKSDPEIAKHLTEDDILYYCRVMIFNSSGKLIANKPAIGNPEVAYKDVNEFLVQLKLKKAKSVKPK